MLKVNSQLECEDLLYAVLTRQQILDKMMKEAKGKNDEIADTLRHETIRLKILRSKLEAHLEDFDYRDDIVYRLYPDMCTD